VVTQFQNLSAYAAVIGRLGAMWEATAPEPAAPAAPARPPGPARPAVATDPDGRRVAYEGLTLRTPREGRPLVRDLSLEVPEGKRLVIMGPCGAGKSALLLAAAGLWQEGQGRVVRPGRGVMFLPQRPYTPPGRLRDQLLYGLGRADLPDDRLLAVLREVGLGALAAGADGLDAERDWRAVLSEGEQRALAFARLLLANPRFAFLDDPAGPLDEARVEYLYAALARTQITYVSAGCHRVLLKYHDLRLELSGDGGWQLGPAS
jgi:putative ATP-binding cassette transporter